MKIFSLYNSDNYEVIEILLSKWKGSNWKSETEVNSVFETHYIDIEMISAYFDFFDFEKPVHTNNICLYKL